MDEITAKILLGVSSTTVVLLLGILKMYHDQLRETKLKLSDKKYETYFAIISTLFDLINRQKKLNDFSDDELLKKMMDVKRNLLLYGSDKVVKKFFEWESNQLTGKRLWNWVELAALARKDMGNRWTKVTADDILKSLLNDQDDYKKFKYELLNKKYY